MKSIIVPKTGMPALVAETEHERELQSISVKVMKLVRNITDSIKAQDVTAALEAYEQLSKIINKEELEKLNP